MAKTTKTTASKPTYGATIEKSALPLTMGWMGNLFYWRTKGIVTITTGDILYAEDENTGTAVGILPEGCRPKATIRGTDHIGPWLIGPGGEIMVSDVRVGKPRTIAFTFVAGG